MQLENSFVVSMIILFVSALYSNCTIKLIVAVAIVELSQSSDLLCPGPVFNTELNNNRDKYLGHIAVE